MKHTVEKFIPLGGKHCITNALKQIFYYHAHPMSEEMIFGIASGLAFTYINLANSPMVSGRTKPFEFESKLAERLNITINCKQPKTYELAFTHTKKLLDKNLPVLIYVDMPFLSYLNLDKNSHFGGHAVVIAGYDDGENLFYVSDRDNHDYPIRTPNGSIAEDFHAVGFDEMALARNSNFRPFPANNKYLEFDFSGFRPITGEVIACAISDTCESMLNPPANLLGINGIYKFSKEIIKWNKFDTEKRKISGITNYFQISGDGGTGGGIFRKMYGDFLIEADGILPDKELSKIGLCYKELAMQWDLLADSMWLLGDTGDVQLIGKMSNDILKLYETEKELLGKLHALIQ